VYGRVEGGRIEVGATLRRRESNLRRVEVNLENNHSELEQRKKKYEESSRVQSEKVLEEVDAALKKLELDRRTEKETALQGQLDQLQKSPVSAIEN
jgi:hypothetical protein